MAMIQKEECSYPRIFICPVEGQAGRTAAVDVKQENEELLQKTRGEIEFRVSKNMWNFGGCEFPRTHKKTKG